jgi:hypothetical protein
MRVSPRVEATHLLVATSAIIGADRPSEPATALLAAHGREDFGANRMLVRPGEREPLATLVDVAPLCAFGFGRRWASAGLL